MIFILWAIPFAMVALALLVGAACTGVTAALRCHWRRAASTVALPVLLILSLPLVIASQWGANELHFWLFSSHYVASVPEDACDDVGRFVLFDWGGNVMVGFDRFLVYDCTDEIARPATARSAAWNRRLRNQIGEEGSAFTLVQSVARHFYVVDLR
jgi:hypothetical protein